WRRWKGRGNRRRGRWTLRRISTHAAARGGAADAGELPGAAAERDGPGTQQLRPRVQRLHVRPRVHGALRRDPPERLIARVHDGLAGRAHPSATPPVVEWSRRAWASDLGLTALTLATFAVVFVLEPLSESFPLTSWLLLAAEIVFSAAVVAAITALTGQGWMATVADLLAAVIFYVPFAGRFDTDLSLHV